MQTNDPCDVLIRHLKISADQAEIWDAYIAKLTFGQDPHVFDFKRDLEGLENLERAMTALSTALDIKVMTESAYGRLLFNILFGPYAEALGEGKNGPNLPEGHSKYAEEIGKKVTYWIRDLEEHLPRVRDAIQATKKHIRSSPQSKIGVNRMNLTGIQLVENARSVWRLSTGSDAPEKSLNPASPFGKFLYELFEAYQIEGDPRSAFRAWSSL